MADPFEALDGIGPERAADLRAAGFESVADLLAAGANGLTAVDGIGPATADRVLAAAAEQGIDEQDDDVVIGPREGRLRLPARPLLTRAPTVAEPFRRATPIGPVRLPERAGEEGEDTVLAREPAAEREPSPGAAHRQGAATGADSTKLLRLAGDLLRTGADEQGRIGGRRLAPTDVPAELTVSLHPSEDGELSAAEPALFEWLNGSADRPAQFLIDPETVLAEAAPGESIDRRVFDRPGDFQSTPLRSVAVRLVEAER